MHDFAPATSITLEFYMLTESEDPDVEGAEIRLTGDGGQKECGIWFASGLFGHTDPGWIGVEQYHPTLGSIWTPVMEYDEGIWYYVRREVDFVAGTGSVYVEEVDNPSNNAFADLPPTGIVTYVDELRLLSSNSGKTDSYVDGIQITAGPATLEIEPDEYCVTDVNGDVLVYITLNDIDPAHPIYGATFNVEWDPSFCWQLCDLPDVEPVAPFEQIGEDTGPGFARYSVGIPSLEGITDAQAIAVLCFHADLPPDGCCVETLSLVVGPPGWTTMLTGEDTPPYIYYSEPILGPDQQIRLDAEAPIIDTCVPEQVEDTDPGDCTWNPSAGDIEQPIWTENCEDCTTDLTFVRSDGKPDLNQEYQLGETFIDWTIEDCCTNAVGCTTRIVVEDNEPPGIDPPTWVYDVSVGPDCTWTLPDGTTGMYTITDNCEPDPNITQVPPAGTVWGPGSYTMTVNVNDSHGNNTSGVYFVNVRDTDAPVITLAPDDVEIYTDAGKCTGMFEWDFAAVDNCNCVTLSCDYPSGTDFPLGVTTVTCVAADCADPVNETTHVFTVEVTPFWQVEIQVDLSGWIHDGPFDRCMQFEMRDCDGVLPDQDFITPLEMVMANGVTIVDVPVGTPDCEEGFYTCAQAKDIRYSLRRTVEGPGKVDITPDGRMFVLNFVGADALLLGDLDANGWVDIDDWARWNYQLLGGMIPTIPVNPCDGPPDPTDQLQQHGDYSGDGFVTGIDFSHLHEHYAQSDDPACFAMGLAMGSDPRLTIPVAELEDMGIVDAAQYDSNGDGQVTGYEVGLTDEPTPVPAQTKAVQAAPVRQIGASDSSRMRFDLMD